MWLFFEGRRLFRRLATRADKRARAYLGHTRTWQCAEGLVEVALLPVRYVLGRALGVTIDSL